MNPEPVSVKIKEIKKETEACVSLVLDPTNFNPPFLPGQFLNMTFEIDGEPYTRSYSVSSTVGEDLQVSIKRIRGGKVSEHVVNQLKPGDHVLVQGPEGRFIVQGLPSSKLMVFVAAGSGITPIWSMIKGLLHKKDHPAILLFYGNRRKEDVIFLDALQEASKASDNFDVQYYLTKPKSWLGLINREDLTHTTGRIQCLDVIQSVYERGLTLKDIEIYICGPTGLNTELKSELLASGCPEEHIRIEHFVTKKKTTGAQGEMAKVEVILGKETIHIECGFQQSILEALIEKGFDPPHSCTSGACCTCMALLEEGSVQMDRKDALSKQEIQQGFILTCQGTPTARKLKVNYDID